MAVKHRNTYRLVRWAIQLAFLLLFVILFARTRYGLSPAGGDVFFRFDPLVLLVVSIAGRTLIAAALPAIIFVIATVLFGRFFCGFVCPLGTTIDLFDGVTRNTLRATPDARRQTPEPRGSGVMRDASGVRQAVMSPESRWRYGKYATLFFLVVAALLGFSFTGFLDPLVIMERSLALVFFPAVSRLGGVVGSLRPAVFTDSLLALGVFGLVLGLGLVAPRFWCRNLCPLGGLYALLAKFSLFRFHFAGECSRCGVCDKVCPTGAIRPADSRQPTADSLTVDPAECIDCLACRFSCARGTIRYGLKPRPERFDVGRREAILAIGSGIVLAPLARGLVHQRLQARLIRPPGAVPEPAFQNACIRCGRCMKACPNNALQPTVLEAGAAGIWTPHLVPRIGGCERNCNLCGQVCPTGAIRNLPLDEKSFAKIGTAVVDRGRCIAWELGRACLVCDEACQYNAITAVANPAGTALCPDVDEDACVGCGMCESRCPVQGAAAIRVFSSGEERRRSGSYKTESRVRRRECGGETPDEVPAGFIEE